jgi:acyl carrier protein
MREIVARPTAESGKVNDCSQNTMNRSTTETMDSSKEQIIAEVKKILVDELFVEIPMDKIKESDSLGADIGLDSVGQIEFVSIIEERYGLKIDLKASAAQLKTIGATADYIWKNLQPVRQ